MSRVVYDTRAVNTPRTIAGVEWRLVVAIFIFFGSAALMQRVPALMVAPAILLWVLSGPGRRDPAFLRIYLRHRAQRDRYSPAYNLPDKSHIGWRRPVGFGRNNWF